MNRKQWGYRIVGIVACLAVFCIVAVRQADVQVPVVAEKTVSIQEEQSDTIAPQSEENALTKEQTIHTQTNTNTNAICLPTGNIVRGFGWQEDGGAWRYHSGIDIAYAKGEQVRIIRGGTVARIEPCAGGYAVEVKSGDDLWRYEPLADVSTTVGTQVEAGTVISTMREEAALHIGRRYQNKWEEPIRIQN